MKTTIVVAGATGNLGGRIAKALLKKGAAVRAVVRHQTDQAKVDQLEQSGVEVVRVDMSNIDELAKALNGADCVVSAIAGLRDVIVNAQTVLLDAAIAAGVPRFIPSDFSTDFTKLAMGDNRNFDLRKEFKEIIDKTAIKATSIFNGAFAEMLQYNMPFLNLKDHTIGFMESSDRWVEFTTMDDTAAFTAAAALDPEAPRDLCIASFQVTASEIAEFASAIFETPFKTIPMGGLEHLREKNLADRAADPEGEKQLYPKWQTSQYFYSMFTVLNDPLDNDRYPGIEWMDLQTFLEELKKR